MEKLRTKIKRFFAPKQRILKPIYWDNFDVTITELARLFKCTPGCISKWVELKGLARLKNGRFNLREAVNWLAEHYKQQATIQIRLDAVSQNQLCELLGVSRQSIFN